MIKYLYFLISYVTPTKFSDRSTTTAWCDRNRKGQTDGDINKVFMFCPSRLYDLLPLSRINVNAYLAKSRVKPHNTHFVLCGLKYWGWYDTCVSDRERIRSCQFFGMDKIQRNLSYLIFFDSIANILRLGMQSLHSLFENDESYNWWCEKKCKYFHNCVFSIESVWYKTGPSTHNLLKICI